MKKESSKRIGRFATLTVSDGMRNTESIRIRWEGVRLPPKFLAGVSIYQQGVS